MRLCDYGIPKQAVPSRYAADGQRLRVYLQWREGHSACHWQTLVATRLDGRRDELAVTAPKDRQQDEDLRTLEAALSQFPTTLGGPNRVVPSAQQIQGEFLQVQKGIGGKGGTMKLQGVPEWFWVVRTGSIRPNCRVPRFQGYVPVDILGIESPHNA